GGRAHPARPARGGGRAGADPSLPGVLPGDLTPVGRGRGPEPPSSRTPVVPPRAAPGRSGGPGRGRAPEAAADAEREGGRWFIPPETTARCHPPGRGPDPGAGGPTPGGEKSSPSPPPGENTGRRRSTRPAPSPARPLRAGISR